MNEIKKIYKDGLIYVFNQSQLKNLDTDFLVIVKDGCDIIQSDKYTVMQYHENFEYYLNFKLPSKNRKPKMIMNLDECHKVIDSIHYGVLSFCYDDLPYSVALNHIIINSRIIFHGSKNGFKLNGIGQRATYLIVDDLGINLELGTHNYNSVALFGRIKAVDDFETKKAALIELVKHSNSKHPYNDKMTETTNFFELEIDYINGKSHIL